MHVNTTYSFGNDILDQILPIYTFNIDNGINFITVSSQSIVMSEEIENKK